MSGSTKHSVSRVAVVTTAVLLLTVGLSGPIAAATSDGSTTDSWSDGIDSMDEARAFLNESRDAEIEASEDDRFTEIWSDRLTNESALQAYREADGIPDHIREEGFHDLTEDEEDHLVSSLLLEQLDHPRIERKLDNATPTERLQMLKDYKRNLQLVVFEKHRLQERLHDTAPREPAKRGAESDLAENVDREISQPTPTLDPNASSAQDPLVELAGPNGEPAIPEDLEARQPERIDARAAATEHAVPDREIAQPAPTPTPRLPQLEHEPVDVPDIPVPTTPQGHEEFGPMIRDLRSVVDGATYTLCSESPTKELECSDPVPLGTPHPVDVDGDDVPDATARLSPVVDQITENAYGAEFELRRDNVTTEPLPGHVFAVYDIPMAYQRVSAGFASDDTLARESTAQFTLKDPADALEGDIKFAFDLENRQPGDDLSLTFATKDLQTREADSLADTTAEPKPEDPITGEIRLSPVPTSSHVDGRIQDTEPGRDVKLSLEQTVATELDANVQMLDSSENRLRQIQSHVDRVPRYVNITYRTPTPDVTKVHYDASSKIDELVLSDHLVYDTENPDTFRDLSTRIVGIPTEIDVQLTQPYDAIYEASDRLESASFTLDRVKNGKLVQRLTGTAEGIPQRIHLQAESTAEMARWIYDASSQLDRLEGSVLDRTDTPVRANLLVEDLPRHVEVAEIGDEMRFSTDQGSVGLIEAGVSINGVDPIELEGDHATFTERGPGIAAHARLHGLSTIEADPSDGGDYRIELSPGGQPFQALALLEDDTKATLEIGALPTVIDVDLTAPENRFSYTANDRISFLNAAYTEGEDDLTVNLSMEGLPQSVELTWTDASEKRVTYDASGSLDRIEATYTEGPDGFVFDVAVKDLPNFMQARITGDSASFDARDGRFAPSGSDSIGEIHFRAGTQGRLLSDVPNADHFVLDASDDDELLGSLRYSGLANLEASTGSNSADLHVENSQPNLVLVDVDTQQADLTVEIDKLPTRIDVHLEGNEVTYDASSTIDRIEGRLDLPSGDFVSARLTNAADHVDVDLTPGQREVTWRSSPCSGSDCQQSTADLAAEITLDETTWTLGAHAEEIPRHWRFFYGDERIEFDAVSSPIGLAEATVTNHDDVRVLSGNHASAVVEENGNFDASLRVSDIDRVLYENTTQGMHTNIQANGGHPFEIAADADLGEKTVSSKIQIDAVPHEIDLQQRGERFVYEASDNFGLRAKVVAGHEAAISDAPEVPNVRGFSVTDGSGCNSQGCGEAFRAHAFLEGLPTRLDVDPANRTYSIENFDPPETQQVCFDGSCPSLPADYLEFDVTLDDVVDQRIDLWAVQRDIPGPVDITFGPYYQGSFDGARWASFDYEATDQLGSFELQARLGTTFADVTTELQISNIPREIDVFAWMGEDRKRVDLDNSDPVDQIRLRTQASATITSIPGQLDADGLIKLTDVPASVDLTFGQIYGNGQTLPGFDYDASSSTLDVLAEVSGQLFTPHGDVTAFAQFETKNLARHAQATLDRGARELDIDSSTTTDRVEMHAWARVDRDVFEYECFPHCGATAEATVSVDGSIHPTVRDFWIRAKDLQDMNVELGVFSTIRGDFGQAAMGWDDIAFPIDLDVDAWLELDLGVGTWREHVVDTNVRTTLHLNLDFHVLKQQRHVWKNFDTHLPCLDGSYELQVELKPKHARSTRNSFSVSDPSNAGGAWLVLPTPTFVPDTVAQFGAVLASPLHSGAWLDYECR